ncbi:LysE family translocator [Acetobacteraceae bacterium]|nr:LysE family translocator [Acetobacteraceae bacterium]
MTSSIISSLFAYTLASIFLAAAPGPDMLLVLRSATRNGKSSAFGVIFGIVTSQLIWGIATILGLSALLFHFKEAFTLLKWGGTLYLTYLGIRLLLSRSEDILSTAEPLKREEIGGQVSFKQGYYQGVVTNLLNPMIGVLFLVIFPSFIPQGADIKLFTFILTLIQMLVAFSIFTILALASQLVSSWIKEGKGVVWIDRIAGIALLYFAIKLFFAHSPI